MKAAHKIEITPNDKQRTYLEKCFGTSRFVYNWALTEWQRQYKDGLKPNAVRLKREFNAIKHEQYPWISEVTKWAAQQPFVNLETAFDRFFRKLAEYPKLKKKSKSKKSVYLTSGSFKVEGEYLKIPLLPSRIKMTEIIRFEGKLTAVTISRRADRYFASFQVEVQEAIIPVEDRSVGIDVGIKNLFVTSDAHVVKAIKPLKSQLAKLKRAHRRLSKKQKGSKNRLKAKAKLQRLYLKISNLREDILHKFTTFLVKHYSIIKIEDLNVRGMLKNHKLALAISDIGIGEFVRMLTYKCKLYGRELLIADRFFPSSKLCSGCGRIKSDLTLKDRIYKCECGMVIDRDFNPTLNLNKLGRAPTEVTPVEMLALQRKIFPYFVTSVVETGIKQQSYV